jgi:signal transduction histidine kinase
MRPIAVAGLAPEQEQRWWEVESREHRLGEAPSDPMVLARLRAGETVVLDMSQPPFRDQPNPLSAISPLVAPMRLGERLVGLLGLDHGPVAHVYAPEEIAVAGAVAKLCALVIERERLQAAREQAQARELALREANFRMDEFLSIASHELRTPLTTIRANVQLIERRLRTLLLAAEAASADDTRQAAHVATGTLETELTQRLASLQLLLKRTEKQTLRLDRLVGDLLDVSRIQAGNLDLRLEPCDLARVVREAVEEQRASWPERGLTLDLLAGPIAVLADADRIGQVVSNYLTNALKYSPAKEPVAVMVRVEHARSKRGQSRVRVRVHDHGPGLLADEQARIWERFHRAPGITLQSGSGVGLGLGLYIAKTIVEGHGGTVGVESAPEAGSTFWFTLPLAM